MSGMYGDYLLGQVENKDKQSEELHEKIEGAASDLICEFEKSGKFKKSETKLAAVRRWLFRKIQEVPDTRKPQKEHLRQALKQMSSDM